MYHMHKKDMQKKMVWGIAFGLLFIAVAAAAWVFSGGSASPMGLFVLFLIGILMIALTVVKIQDDPRYYLVIAVLGVGMTVIGAGMVVVGTLGYAGAVTENGESLITCGLIMAFCGAIWLLRSKEKKIADERSQKIGTYGTAFSWYLTFMAVVILYWLDMLGIFALQTSGILGGLMFLMIASALFFQWYFNRRGDVY